MIRMLLIVLFFLPIFAILPQTDNSNWIIYNTDNSPLTVNSISAIEIWGDSVFIGTRGGGLGLYYNNSWYFYNSENPGFTHNSIFSLAKYGNILYCGSYGGGLSVVSGKKSTTYNSGNSKIGDNFIYSLSPDSSGNIYIGTWGSGLIYRKDTSWISISKKYSLPVTKAPSVLFDSKKRLWIGMLDGLALIENDSCSLLSGNAAPLPSGSIYDIFEASDGKIYIGFKELGLAIYDKGMWEMMNFSNSDLPTNRIWSIAEDSKGAIWIGTYLGGLVKYQNRIEKIYNTENSELPDNYIFCVKTDKYDNVWIGALKGGLAIFNESGITLP